MVAKGYQNGRLVKTGLAKTKSAARELMLSWHDCDAFAYGRRAYTPSQAYAGLAHATPHIELGINF